MVDAAPKPDPAAPYIFISYASADRERVMPVVAVLTRAGIPVWIDREGIAGGENYALEITEAIERAAALVLMCSAASLSSRNVKQEIALAWKYERPYVPLLLEAVVIPRDVEYWLEASQWVEVLDKAEGEWLPQVLTALVPCGIARVVPRQEAIHLAGREKELALLREKLAVAKAGKGGLVLIGGEAGIGKTTLAESALREAAGQGFAVLEGHCFDLAETPPYGPWIDLFAHLPAAPSSSPLLPLPYAFARRGTVGGVASQMALFVAVEDFLTALAARQPVVVLLDDLHWADPASLDLLRFLARSVAGLPLLVLVTYRSDELTRKHPLYPLLPQLAREAGADRIDLGRLGDDVVRALLVERYALSAGDTGRLAAYLQGRAEGNALFVGELLRSLEETDALREEAGVWRLGDLIATAVPALLRQVIDGRLRRLDAENQRLLAVAAVIGHEVPLDTWVTVGEADEEAVLVTVEQGLDARLLVEVSVGDGMRFAHALIREALYEAIPGVRRRRIHRRVAEVLATESQPDPDAVAHHFQQAGDPRAVTWLMKAGQRAQETFAWRTAVARYEVALALMGDADAAARGWHLYRLGLAYRFTDPRQGLTHLDAATHFAGVAPDSLLAAVALWTHGYLRCWAGELRDGVEELAAGTEAIEALPRADWIRLATIRDLGVPRELPHGTLIEWTAIAGQYARAAALGERWFIPRATVEPQDAMPWADGWRGLGLAYAMLGRPDEARHAFERARAGYERIGHGHVAWLPMFEMLILVSLPYAEDHGEQRGRITKEIVAMIHRLNASREMVPEAVEAACAFVEGRWDDPSFSQWMEPAVRARLPTISSTYLGWRYREQGQRQDAWGCIRHTLPAGPNTDPGDTKFVAAIMPQRLAVTLALDAGERDTAHDWLAAHDRWLDWSGATLGQSEGQALWARYHRQAGDIEKAQEHAKRALAHATEPRQPLALLAAHRLLGELDTEVGRYDDADAHLQESLALAEACEAPYERARTLLAMAEQRAATKDKDDARRLLAEVTSICEPLGAKPALARADALRARLASG